ncbi:hypothetical protein B0H67DRAFT_648979 [Lasiosphaeris hirsuta]|uniref:Uncharacterized protein n=1 Tax=Lasiosphaeris hirsuta TaxID=260670 RepID=A0AA39ZVM7_9PEZI|nr:hypothetical protein B0H67DRAFT_648979 [Lasiosphaeris hirsuta]
MAPSFSRDPFSGPFSDPFCDPFNDPLSDPFSDPDNNNLFIKKEQDEMIFHTLQVNLGYAPQAVDSVDKHFDLVVRADGFRIKNDQRGEKPSVDLIMAMMESSRVLQEGQKTATLAKMQWAALLATPFFLAGVTM